jgi:hypothetical protein
VKDQDFCAGYASLFSSPRDCPDAANAGVPPALLAQAQKLGRWRIAIGPFFAPSSFIQGIAVGAHALRIHRQNAGLPDQNDSN